jgi:hypothetical protein
MKHRLATAGLVAFLAADVALVAVALRTGRDQAGALPSVTRTAALTTDPATGPAATPTTKPVTPRASSRPSDSATSPPAAAVPVTRLVSALDAATAWRATTGSCDAGGAVVEVTTDGGETWTRLRSPARAVARVQALDENRAFLIAAGADCSLRQYSTNDVGGTWQAPTTVSGGWSRSLDDPTSVLAPQQERTAPCGDDVVVDLSRTSAAQAEALCGDGSVVVTNDGGVGWSDSGDAPGGVALSNLLVDKTLTTYAARIVSDCKGVQVVRVIEGRNASIVACVPVTAPVRGKVGLSVTDRAGWIVSGNQTWVSLGDLTSWKQV